MEKFNIGDKELCIGPTKIHWENQLFDSFIEHPTKIRFGISPIEFDMFTIGSKFKIELKNEKNEIFKIALNSYFGIGRKRKYQLYDQIVDVIWNNYFAEPFGNLLRDWENGQTISVGKYDIDSYGITRKVGVRGINMSFEEMELLPRFDHLLVNSKVNSNKYLKLIYLDDWNWPLINDILYKKSKMHVSTT